MPDQLVIRIMSTAKQIFVPRNTVLLKPGEICDHLYYIEQGLLCSHEIEGKNRYCTWLMLEGDIATSVNSFNFRELSKERIESLEDCILHTITYNDLEAICQEFPDFRIIRQHLTDKYYNQAMQMDVQRKRPPEQFYSFLDEHKHFTQLVARVPAVVLASFMGIHRTTLHEIKKAHQKGKK